MVTITIIDYFISFRFTSELFITIVTLFVFTELKSITHDNETYWPITRSKKINEMSI